MVNSCHIQLYSNTQPDTCFVVQTSHVLGSGLPLDMIALDENSRLALCDSSLPSFKDGETLWLWRHGVIIQPQQVSKHLLPAETALDTKVYNLVVCQLISWPKRNAENVLFLPTWSKDNYGTVGRRASHG